MRMAWIESCKDGIVLQLHCQPGAKVTRVVGEHDGRLKIALHAPAVENRANEALVQWLADVAGVPRRAVELLSGHTSRKKRVLLRDVDRERLIAALDAARKA